MTAGDGLVGKKVVCISNWLCKSLEVGKTYEVVGTRLNEHHVYQVSLKGESGWHSFIRFKLVKEKEMSQQKFYKNDKVKRIKDFSSQTGCVEDIVYTVVNMGSNTIAVDDGYYISPLKDVDNYELLERAWQPNTGVQPVGDDVLVEVTLQNGEVRKEYADDLYWSEGGFHTVVRWRLADSNPAMLVKDFKPAEEQPPEAIPPSHVVVGSELASTDAQEWTDKHYSNHYTLTQKDIDNGFVKIDPYFVSKMWKIGSKDDSGALWHCFKTIARFGEKNSREREIKALYAQIKCLAELEGVVLE